MKPDSNSQQEGGMSRAARKRAKKNKKKNENKRHVESIEEQEEKISVVSKKMKLDGGNKFDGKGQNIDGKEAHDGINIDDGVDLDDEKTPVLPDDSVDFEIPTFPNTPLMEILLLKDIEDTDKKNLLQALTSEGRAACLFQAIIDPIPLKDFYKEYWEKKPLLVRAKNRKRYDGLLSLESIKQLSKNKALYYAQDLNVARYKKDANGMKRRVTLDKLPTSEEDEETGVLVDKTELWSNYENGCTIRLLRPHKHEDSIQSLLSTLELELQCMVGANAYLTPPNSSQGFAPHYDDIEAFCLQLQGSKRWKVYEPTLKLPRVSSEDFTTEDLEGMEPVMDITLEKGDLLYMPRGWIHQACTLKDENEHSLHLTVSAMQQWAWADLLEMVMPEALEAAASNESSISLRQGLPRGFLDYMGAMYEEPDDSKLPESMKKIAEEQEIEKIQIRERKMLQEKFRAEAKQRIMKVAKTAFEMVDIACDQLAKRFMSDRQPPALTKRERAQTSRENEKDILPNTKCRLVRPGIARLVIEEEQAVVYHCGDNSRVYRDKPLNPLEYEMDDGPSLEQLITTVEPGWILVNNLYHDTIEDKVAIAQSLYDEGILAIDNEEESSE